MVPQRRYPQRLVRTLLLPDSVNVALHAAWHLSHHGDSYKWQYNALRYDNAYSNALIPTTLLNVVKKQILEIERIGSC